MPLDAILTEVSVNWFANAPAGMAACYRENALAEAEPRVSPRRPASPCSPTTSRPSRSFAERDNSNIVHWSRFERGGHYAALEVPELVVGDIRAFFGQG